MSNSKNTKEKDAVASAVDAIVMWLFRLYFRTNAVIGYLIMLPVDYLVYKTTGDDWREIRAHTLKVIRKCWYKY